MIRLGGAPTIALESGAAGKGGVPAGAVDGAADVDAVFGVFLRSGVGGEDLDGVVNAGSCD